MGELKVYHDYLVTSKVPQIILQRRQKELDKLPGKRKYAIEEYGIWTIPSEIGPLSNIPEYDIWGLGYPIFIAQTPIKLLKSQNLYPRYFLKIVGNIRRALEKIIFQT